MFFLGDGFVDMPDHVRQNVQTIPFTQHSHQLDHVILHPQDCDTQFW